MSATGLLWQRFRYVFVMFSTHFQRLCLRRLWERLFAIFDAKKLPKWVSFYPWWYLFEHLGRPDSFWKAECVPKVLPKWHSGNQKGSQSHPKSPKMMPKGTPQIHKTIFKLILHSRRGTTTTLSEQRPGGLREALTI